MSIRVPTLILFSLLALLGLPGPEAVASSQAGARYGAGQQRGTRQGGPRVLASATKALLKVGERSAIRVTVENTRDARLIQMPNVDGLSFDEPSAPSRNSSFQSINGRVSRSFTTTWTVFFRVDREGDFTVPPFTVEVQGQPVETRPIAIRAVKDIRGENLGFLEIRPSAMRVVEGQPFTLELSFGWETTTGVTYANLYLPWWGELPGTLELERPLLSANTPKEDNITINRELRITAEHRKNFARDGREFTHYRIIRSFLPTRSGILEIPTSSLEFGRESKSFSLFDRPKRQGYIAQGEPFDIEVISLPTEDQPFDFSGAVGSFSVRASSDTRDVVVGDSIKLAVEWSGSGNLEFFEAPDISRLEAFHGFRVYGKAEDKSFERRRVTYDIAPLSADVIEIPSVSMSVYDPLEQIYTSIESNAITIRVRALERSADLGEEDSERFESDINDIDTQPLTRDIEPLKEVPENKAVLATMASLPVLWLCVRTGVRRRRGDPSAPRERRRRKARKMLVRELRRANDAEDRLGALMGFLAARTDESQEAWIGRDPLLWVSELSSSDSRFKKLEATEAMTHTRDLMLALERATWGGETKSPQAKDILALADELVEAGL